MLALHWLCQKGTDSSFQCVPLDLNYPAWLIAKASIGFIDMRDGSKAVTQGPKFFVA
jgi:hypothetical protein